MRQSLLAVLMVFGVLLSGGATCDGQTIQFQLLNGKTGKPIRKSRIQIAFLSSGRDAFQLETDKDGNASFDSKGEKAFAITALFVIACDGRLRSAPEPTYQAETVFSRGVVTRNTCGKWQANPTHGKLIYYVRPATWLELTKN